MKRRSFVQATGAVAANAATAAGSLLAGGAQEEPHHVQPGAADQEEDGDQQAGHGHRRAVQGLPALRVGLLGRRRLARARGQRARRGQFHQWLNCARVSGGQPVLLGFLGGFCGHDEEANLTDAQIVADAMAALREMYGPDIPEPIGWQIPRWGTDPYAYGSYSSTRSGPRRRCEPTLRPTSTSGCSSQGRPPTRTCLPPCMARTCRGWPRPRRSRRPDASSRAARAGFAPSMGQSHP